EMNRVFPSKKKCFPQLPGDRRDRSHGERVAVPLPIQQAVSHQSVELLGNHRHVILIANESGIESHSEEHRKHHAHHCRGIGVSRNLTSRDRVVDNRGIKPRTASTTGPDGRAITVKGIIEPSTRPDRYAAVTNADSWSSSVSSWFARAMQSTTIEYVSATRRS